MVMAQSTGLEVDIAAKGLWSQAAALTAMATGHGALQWFGVDFPARLRYDTPAATCTDG